jgi:hypothetical protein
LGLREEPKRACSKALPIRTSPEAAAPVIPQHGFPIENIPGGEIATPVEIPPCPDYKSMAVPELKVKKLISTPPKNTPIFSQKLLANYGFRSGTKSYMIRELTAAWTALHSPQESAPPPVVDVLPPRDQFRSPPARHRTRKVVEGASPFTFNKLAL